MTDLLSTRAAAGPVGAPVDPAVPGWVLPAIVVLGIALRVWRILSNGLTFDESFTAMAGRLPVGDLLSYLRHNDSHPPLDYLLRGAVRTRGRERLPPALAVAALLVPRSRCSRGGCATAAGSG